MRTLGVIVIVLGCIWQESLSTSAYKRVKRWTNEPNCGNPQYAPKTVGSRVVGGDAASPHSWPWQSMILCVSRTNATLCGGSIISNQWIITAGHCMLPHTYDILRNCTVSLGKHYLQLPTPEATEQSFGIAEYVVHDRYNHKDIESGFDLALVKLSRVIKYTKEILPICLPFEQPDPAGKTMCYSGGWGYTEGQKVSPSKVLKQISMPVQSDNYCSFTAKSAQHGVIICAGKWDRAQDLCYGDSGGPLACKSESRWYLHGVLSQVDKHCVSVASFAKVKKFQDWIESTIG